MYKNLILLLLFIPFKMITSCWKPPFPAPHKKALRLEDLDCDLRARPFTIIDQLQENLEDERLDEQEKKDLDNLLAEQNHIIDQYKIFYLGLISEQKKINFNGLFFINHSITSFRNLISEKMIEVLKIEIKKLAESRLKVEATKLLSTEKSSGQRRDRE
jgi:hypothetical protein